MRRLIIPTLAGLVAGSLLAGCPDREVSRVDPLQDNVLDKDIPVNLNRNLDILFVIDNSLSMAAEQASLAANFPQFINVLQQIEGGLPDVHIGVVSSNMGAAGASSVPGCANPGDDGNLLTGPPGNTCQSQFSLTNSYVSDISQPDGSRVRNYTGDLSQLFSCMAQLGTSGCGFEMHLESMYAALQPGKNPGFYRDEAYLAVIFIADEDDCSTADGTMFTDPNAGVTSPLGPRTSFRCHEFGIECDNDPNPRAFGTKLNCRPRTSSPYMYTLPRYIDFLRNLKSDPKLIIVAGIVGVFDQETGTVVVGPDATNATWPEVQKSCGYDPNDDNAGASPPVRLTNFMVSFPERNTFTTICNSNLSDALVQIATLLKTAIGNPCIDAPLADRNPDLPGLQEECSVADVTAPDGPNRTETVIPKCDANHSVIPCWEFVADAVQCPDAPDNLAIEVDRGGFTPPLGTVLQLQCVTE